MITWRELRDRLDELPEDVMDMPACAWIPRDADLYALDEFAEFTELSAYDSDEVVSSGNPVSLSLGI